MTDEIHAGPIMDKVGDIPRHCETVEPNHTCYYLVLGCLGCTLKGPPLPIWTDAMRRKSPIRTEDLPELVAKMRQQIERKPTE